jgi:hypothetical protein
MATFEVYVFFVLNVKCMPLQGARLGPPALLGFLALVQREARALHGLA